MELLIPGLLLVGFMVWASTRIKRNAAKAFDREEIETSEFSIIKPEGLLSVVDPPDGLLFSAYSKEFGTEPAERIRRASAEIRAFPDAHFEDVVERAKIESDGTPAEQTGVIGGCKCATIVTERLEQGIPLESHYKIISGPAAVYQLLVSVLPEHKDEFQPAVDTLLGSFSLT